MIFSALRGLTVILMVTLFSIPLVAYAEKRALLIGLSAYENLEKLHNPPIDVILIEAKLQHVGYKITIVDDHLGKRKTLVEALDNFVSTIEEGDEVVIFYSGHGIQLTYGNMIVPTDAPDPIRVTSRLLSEKLIAMQTLVESVNERLPRVHFWLIDACRTNPYANPTRGGSRAGLGQFDSGIPNSLIFFSANRNQVALDRLPDDPPGKHLGSPFVRAFVELFDLWRTKNATLYVKQVRQRLRQLVTPDAQYPMIEDAIDDQWCFGGCDDLSSTTILAAGRGPKVDKSVWESVAFSKPHWNGFDSSAVLSPGGVQRPAVFIGKASGASCESGTVSDAYPFGCELLQKVALRFSERGSPFRAYQVNATSTTAVNMRAQLPSLGQGGAKYSRVLQTVPPNTQVKLSGFAALQYAGDTFYWGLIESAP